jgi:hypothetical protein
MSEPKPKSEAIYVRVTPETKRAFADKAARFEGGGSEVLRGLVDAFIEDRLTVMPPTDKKESLYDVFGKQD